MLELLLTIVAPFIGGVIYGFERVLKARMQNRVGPPLLQPFYDMYKLMDKQSFIIHPLHVILGVMHFLTLWIVVAFTIYGGNLLYIVLLHFLSTSFIIFAGFSVKSVYSHIGSNRELLALVAYEPIFILVATAFYLLNGTYDISAIRDNPPQILTLILLFISFVMTMPIKLKKSPFDATEAHQEIVGGVEIEYSGIYFEFIYMSKWLEYVFVYLLLFLFAGNSLLLATLLFITLFVVINLVDNSTARVNIAQMIKIVLAIALPLAVINIIGVTLV